jgi:hypothetical protein
LARLNGSASGRPSSRAINRAHPWGNTAGLHPVLDAQDRH